MQNVNEPVKKVKTANAKEQYEQLFSTGFTPTVIIWTKPDFDNEQLGVAVTSEVPVANMLELLTSSIARFGGKDTVN